MEKKEITRSNRIGEEGAIHYRSSAIFVLVWIYVAIYLVSRKYIITKYIPTYVSGIYKVLVNGHIFLHFIHTFFYWTPMFTLLTDECWLKRHCVMMRRWRCRYMKQSLFVDFMLLHSSFVVSILHLISETFKLLNVLFTQSVLKRLGILKSWYSHLKFIFAWN